MSRIFEALQQLESERTGSPLLQSSATATEVLRAAEGRLGENGTWGFAQSHVLHSSVPPDSRLISVTNCSSLATEKFRFLALRLRQLRQQRPLKKVLVTSTLAEEGKTFVSANLAITMSRKKHQKVLLLEGDLRRPVLVKNFGLGQLSGLSECLHTGTPTSTSIYYVADLGFWFLPAGTHLDNALEFMQSGQLAEMLEQLSCSFDWIVIDSPPLLPLADTSLWSRLVDGTLLVTREGMTEKRQLQRGIELLDKSSILGVVLNYSSNTGYNNYREQYGYGASSTQEFLIDLARGGG